MELQIMLEKRRNRFCMLTWKIWTPCLFTPTYVYLPKGLNLAFCTLLPLFSLVEVTLWPQWSKLTEIPTLPVANKHNYITSDEGIQRVTNRVGLASAQPDFHLEMDSSGQSIDSVEPSQKRAFRHKWPSKPALLYHTTTNAGLLGQSQHSYADTTPTHQLSTAIRMLLTKVAISVCARHIQSTCSVSPLPRTLCLHKDLIAPAWELLISLPRKSSQ